MHVFTEYLLAAMVCMLVSSSATAGVGIALGIHLQEVCFGCGPPVFRWGRLHVRSIPITSLVRFATAEEGNAALPDGVLFDLRSSWQRILVALTGCLAMMFIAVATLGFGGIEAFARGFSQIVEGAISQDHARRLLALAADFAAQSPFISMVGLVAAKATAASMLPLPRTSGGEVVRIVARAIGVDRAWPARCTIALLWIQFLVWLAWAFALASLYLWP